MNIVFTPYYLVLFGCFLFLIKLYDTVEKRKKENISYFCLGILILFFGLRGNIGDDYHFYQAYYDEMTIEETLIYGPGYALINWIFRSVGLPFQCMLFFLSVLTNVMLMNFWKETQKNIPLVIAIFFALGGIINEVDFIRNILSMALFVNSLKYVGMKRNARKFLSLNLVGFLFHYSSLLYLPYYWIGGRALSRRTYVGLLLFGFLFGLCRIPVLDVIPRLIDVSLFSYLDHLYRYIQLYSGVSLSFSLGTVERIATGVLIVVFYKKMICTSIGKVGILAFLCFFLCYGFLSCYAVLATRLGNLYVFGYWIVWPLLIESVSRWRHRMVLYVLMFAYMFLRLLSISLLPQWQYSFCF